jgi:hypothetical protein
VVARARCAACGRVWTLAGLVLALVLCSSGSALAATYTVANTDDSGVGSLRQAVLDANADANAQDTIAFGAGARGQITLVTGQISIAEDLTIAGPGASALTVDGNASTTIFLIQGHTVSISGLTFAAGSASNNIGGTLTGGAILSEGGSLTVRDSVFQYNAAGGPGGSGGSSGAGEGGAIYSTGLLTVVDSTFAHNTAGGNGGGGASSGSGDGGAIFSARSLTLTNSTLTANKAGGAPGGGSSSGLGTGGAISASQAAALTNDTIDGNSLGSASQPDLRRRALRWCDVHDLGHDHLGQHRRRQLRLGGVDLFRSQS